MTDQLSEQSAGAANYRSGIRGAARAYWSAAMDYDQTWDALDTAIRQGIPRAWYEGAKECGIAASELSPEERAEMRNALFNELSYINGFLVFIEANSKAKGGKWGVVSARSELWVNRYNDVRNQSLRMACADKKLAWRLGPTKVHCSSCLKLNGKVKRGSYWQRVDIRPQSPRLECKGFNCLCFFEPTDEALSKGPLPKLP